MKLRSTEPARERCGSRQSRYPDSPPELIKGIREEIDVSRAVFAGLLRVPVPTVEGWEQGRSSPPPSAAALIPMAHKYPDTFDRLASR